MRSLLVAILLGDVINAARSESTFVAFIVSQNQNSATDATVQQGATGVSFFLVQKLR
jgi:hypothetical protein